MGNGIKLGPRATILLGVLLAASAVGILTPTLSNTVSKDVQVTGFAVTLTVDGIPETVAPGDIFRVTATLANNANRPVPAVLRMEVRNPNNTVATQLTVYGGLGERRQSEPRGLDPELGLLRTVRRVRRPGPGRLLGGGPPAIPRELHLQALGRATGRTRDPRPPHLHLRAALSGPTFIFRFKSK